MYLQVRLHLLAGLAMLTLASHPLLAQTRIIQPDHAYEQAFAIIIDTDSYAKANEAVYAYKRMLEETEQLSVYIMVNNWESPSPLREEIIRLHRQDPGLEGVVFIGRIPVAMIREGQHLTSAFKMVEDRFPFWQSSVPSDRFYDDFDLVFDYLQEDEENPLLHYYRLSEHSPQRISSDIYSARIKPMYNAKTNPYLQLSGYLNKVVADRREMNPLNHLFSFLGDGSASGCKVAWADEIVALSKQFPKLGIPGNSLKYMKYDMDQDIKLRLMMELQREELDLAILTMHGSPDVQHLSLPLPVDNTAEMVERVQHAIRRIRLRNLSDSQLEFESRQSNIPLDWIRMIELPDDFNPDQFDRRRNEIFLVDVARMTPNARMIIFDACYNGAFLHDEYMAGAYIFNEGKTIVTHANSVNVLQDIWPQEFIGLLGKGVRIGHIRRPINTLESHIFGDPTFRFYAEGHSELNRFISSNREQSASWESFLEGAHPDLTAYALRIMSQNPPTGFSDMLLDLLSQSPDGSIRLECLYLLRDINDNNYLEALNVAVNDPYELIRRLSAYWTSKTGHPKFIPTLVSFRIQDPYYLRASSFNANRALYLFHPDAVVDEINRQLDELQHWYGREALREELLNDIESRRKMVELELARMLDKTGRIGNLPSKKQAIRNLRNNPYHRHINEYLALARDHSEEEELRVLMLEAFGWFTHSVAKHRIIDSCEEIIRSPRTPEAVRKEAIKTINRLTISIR